MGEGEFETLAEERPKKSRHRKKHLYNRILQQMEFYFSDSNLSKDRFLSQLVIENSHVDVQVFLKFNKIKKLNCTTEDIQKAIRRSDLIGVTDDGSKLYRKKPHKVKENTDSCTIYVENIKADANHESLSQVFSDFGQVVYVSIPKYKHNKANKGFAFIEYETELQANEAIDFFEGIGCKIPSEKSPEELRSIVTFQKGEDTEQNEPETSREADQANSDKADDRLKSPENGDGLKGNEVEASGGEDMKLIEPMVEVEVKEAVKRKNEEPDDLVGSKKQKTESDQVAKQPDEIEESKKKKKSKKEKRKVYIKELGMQVLSKKEWKKLRNSYLNLQRKNMKLFKQYLNKQKFGPKPANDEIDEADVPKEIEDTEQEATKLVYTPGVIVKLRLPEPCMDVKKLKNEIKSVSGQVKYVDIPLPAGSEEVFIRFGTKKAASEFCNQEFTGEKSVLEGDEEKIYWEKIQADRMVKFQKSIKKLRGREKLLKRAEMEAAKHLRFDDENE